MQVEKVNIVMEQRNNVDEDKLPAILLTCIKRLPVLTYFLFSFEWQL